MIQIDENLCKGTEGCKLCIAFCPKDVLGVSKILTSKGVHPAAVIEAENCVYCNLCMIYCPDLAIVVEKKGEVKELL
ncbi:MAG: 4Fe-4S binding protein [Phycisphaerae bacterium]|jgi:2-oxoglutarate ferredoxin oxidoreductase subunit delta|nr:4Fe-4S binding protein [Phycisphaerae bacterium]